MPKTPFEDLPPVEGRPTHPDMKYLSDAVRDSDEESEDIGSPMDVTARFVDREVIAYVVKQRTDRLMGRLLMDLLGTGRQPHLESVAGAAWYDGFTAGVRFDQGRAAAQAPIPPEPGEDPIVEVTVTSSDCNDRAVVVYIDTTGEFEDGRGKLRVVLNDNVIHADVDLGEEDVEERGAAKSMTVLPAEVDWSPAAGDADVDAPDCTGCGASNAGSREEPHLCETCRSS